MSAVVQIGHNNPPEPTPFELSQQEIDDLYGEAKNWADGSPITTQAHADALSKLIADLRDAGKRADERRVDENKPFDEGKAAVQTKYAPLIADTKSIKGKVPLAIDACKKVLAPFLKAIDDAKREEADRQRKAADEARKQAEDAFRASRVDDLAAREEAEALAAKATEAERLAKHAEKDKAKATGGARAMTMRSVYRAEVVNGTEFARFMWTRHRADLDEFLANYAAQLVRSGARELPGVNIIEERVPV